MARTKQPHRRPTPVLWAALCAVGACVVPIGPEFEDEPNLPPYIVQSRPRVGEIVLVRPPDATPDFSVHLADANIHDVLWYRWIYDYPAFDPDRSKIADGIHRIEPSGTVIRGLATPFTPNCLIHGVPRGFSQYRLTLVVSDREFIDGPDDAPFDAVPDDANRIYASWVLNMECK